VHLFLGAFYLFFYLLLQSSLLSSRIEYRYMVVYYAALFTKPEIGRIHRLREETVSSKRSLSSKKSLPA
jgi:hypothetical protein